MEGRAVLALSEAAWAGSFAFAATTLSDSMWWSDQARG